MRIGKIHKRGPEQGYDTTMCNSFYVPYPENCKGVTDDWKKVDCKLCLRSRKRKPADYKNVLLPRTN